MIVTEKPVIEFESSSDAWYTPSWLIEDCRTVMGGIHTDPASHSVPQEIIKADVYYTQETNGLDKEWYGNVWMNPPYSTPLIGQFVHKFALEWINGNIKEGCVLTRNSTETEWFRRLANHSTCLLFLNQRVTFWNPTKGKASNIKHRETDRCGHTLFYFGETEHKFYQVFKDKGLIYYKSELAK